MPLRGWMVLATLALLLQGCAGQRGAQQATPAQVRATVVALMPAATGDREGWAADIQTAFAAQKLDPSRSNLCAVLAVTEQESTYQTDPQVPGLGRIARVEIDGVRRVCMYRSGWWRPRCKPTRPMAEPTASDWRRCAARSS